MSEPVRKPVEQLIPGDVLAQDILAGVQVLLRRGTILNTVQIDRLKRMALDAVRVESAEDTIIEAPPTLRPVKKAPAQVVAPSFASLASNDAPGWMSDGNFSVPVPMQASTPAERVFRECKQVLRDQAGLKPLIDPARDEAVMRRLEAALIQSAVQQRISLDRLAGVAEELSNALDPQGEYLDLSSNKRFLASNDIARHGQHLIASSMQAAKLYRMLVMDLPAEHFLTQLKAHFAMSSVFVLLPSHYYTHSMTNSGDTPMLENTIQRYTEWLASQQFVPLDVLTSAHKRLICQHKGEPALNGACVDLPPETQRWTIAGFYSERLYSLPNRPRLTQHDAAQQVVQHSERLFSSKEVNLFLQRIGFFPLGSLVELSNGDMALIVRQNSNALFKPVVQLVSSNGELGEEQDLLTMRNLFIKRQVLEY